jgi:ribosome-associated heat shock protein Hsp15
VSVRVDKWLWAVRVYKTRAMAKDACTAGRVEVNEVAAKPATKVSPGDVVAARRRDRTVIYRVVEAIERRVSAKLAATYVEDLSPPPPRRPGGHDPDAPLAGRREEGAGRPTKRDRRRIDSLRGRRRRV